MSHVSDLQIDARLQAATQLAVAFRDKFDFSDPKDYARVAEHAFNQAAALWAKADELYAEAEKKDAAEAAKKGGAA